MTTPGYGYPSAPGYPAGQPGPGYPGPQAGPGWPAPHPPVPARRKSRVGLVLGIVFGAVALVCGVPGAIVGIRYLSLDNGPHKHLPVDMCHTISTEHADAITGPADARPENGKDWAGCQWDAKPSGKIAMNLTASIYFKSLSRSGPALAGELFATDRLAASRQARQLDENLPATFSPLRDVGYDAYCLARGVATRITYTCEVQHGNVTVDLLVSPLAESPERLDGADVDQAMSAFLPVAKTLLTDVVSRL